MSADNCVHTDFGEEARKDCSDWSGGCGVAIWQPEKERKKPRLNAEDDEQHDREPMTKSGVDVSESACEIGHIDRPCRCVEQG
mgnify:CR=1 FL=1